MRTSGMSVRPFVTASWIALIVGMACGCASTYDDGLGSPDSVHLKSVQFEDIPVPYGYEMMDRTNESLTYEVPGMRVGRVRYRGGPSGKLDELTEFYRTQMPAHHGWKLDGESENSAKRHLQFSKPRSKCNVSLYKTDLYTFIDVEVDTSHES